VLDEEQNAPRAALPRHRDCCNSTTEKLIDWGQQWQIIAKWLTRPPTAWIPAHEATYEGFIKLVKYGTLTVVVIVALMGFFLT
jgi:Bacterial aa3 type cytochrome c oxidase subunit IV